MGLVGVLALQGDFGKHLEMLDRIQIRGIEVRTPGDLEAVERLIIPGGESTTVGLLMQRLGLVEAILSAAKGGMPIWGTCMGMIVIAKEVEGRPQQFTLGLLDVTVRRNAFGTQIHSFESQLNIDGWAAPVTGIFIRAPVVTRTGAEVSVLSTYEGYTVAVRQNNILGTSFHPELTDDTSMHKYFVAI